MTCALLTKSEISLSVQSASGSSKDTTATSSSSVIIIHIIHMIVKILTLQFEWPVQDGIPGN